MVQINKTINFNAIVKIQNGEVETPVASLNASIGENKLNYTINVSILNEQLINASEENKDTFLADKEAFEAEVKSYLTL